jgi:hypothetical protein
VEQEEQEEHPLADNLDFTCRSFPSQVSEIKVLGEPRGARFTRLVSEKRATRGGALAHGRVRGQGTAGFYQGAVNQDLREKLLVHQLYVFLPFGGRRLETG